MKTQSAWRALPLATVLWVASLGTVIANLQVNLSVKFILNADGTRPNGGIGSAAGFGGEVTHGNQVLSATGRGLQLVVVEYLDIQPPAPPGQPADYWFSLLARENRLTIESAARAEPATWRWHENAINIYVNNTDSGQCSFVGTGSAISLGASIKPGTVVHEVGHIFNLRHTHAGDYTDNPSTPPFALADLRDGDSLPQTAEDNPNIKNHDQLSEALFGHGYDAATPQEKGVVDSAFENVMSYHNENRLLPVQMDIWTLNALDARFALCSPRTWFVANAGSDAASGDNEGSPFATLARALTSASTSVGPVDDVIVLRSGTYTSPPDNLIGVACTLRATQGAVTIR
jgi:hypothetical protein